MAERIENVHVHSGDGLGRRTGLDGKLFDTHAVGADGPAGFGLPPVIDHGNPKIFPGPLEGIGIAALAGEEKTFEVREVVSLFELERGVFFLYGAEGGRCGEESFRLVL